MRLRAGWYLPGSTWRETPPEDRHLAALLAARREGDPARVFSHRSAATLLELPVWSRWLAGDEVRDSRQRGREQQTEPLVTHTTAAPSASSSPTVKHMRHRAALAEADTMSVAGFRCTSSERTLSDLARTEPFPIALACADQWLNRNVCAGREVDREALAAWRSRMAARTATLRGRSGVRAVRALVRLADPRAESPLESVSRLRLLQLGIEVESQVSIPSESGGVLYLDFVFRGLGFFGECDGRVKYTNPGLLDGLSPEEVFLREKRRHNWVSGTQNLRGVRWEAGDTTSRGRFARHLKVFGVPVPGRASRMFGAETAEFLDRLP